MKILRGAFGERFPPFRDAIRRARRSRNSSTTSAKQSQVLSKSCGSRGGGRIRPSKSWTWQFEADYRSGDVPVRRGERLVPSAHPWKPPYLLQGRRAQGNFHSRSREQEPETRAGSSNCARCRCQGLKSVRASCKPAVAKINAADFSLMRLILFGLATIQTEQIASNGRRW